MLTYELPQRREATSWRSWGGVQTQQDVAAEKNRITAELAKLAAKADFPLDILPLAAVASVKETAAIAEGDYDTMLVYAAGGGGNLLQKLISPKKFNLMFLRHDPGPVYLWYEIVHPRFLRKTVDEYRPDRPGRERRRGGPLRRAAMAPASVARFEEHSGQAHCRHRRRGRLGRGRERKRRR